MGFENTWVDVAFVTTVLEVSICFEGFCVLLMCFSSEGASLLRQPKGPVHS